MDIVQPGQYAVFASLIDGGQPCGADGVATSHDLATCVIVDSLDAAATLCREGVERHPGVRFDVFDEAGRGKSPALTVVHPSRARRLEGNPTARRRNNVIAGVLVVVALVLFWTDWNAGGALILPTLLAFNALLLAGRLLQVSLAYASAERRRDAQPDGTRDHQAESTAAKRGIDTR